MITFSRRAKDVFSAVVVAILPLILFGFVFDSQIPASPGDDISARVYPDALIYVWMALSVLYLIGAARGPKDDLVRITKGDVIHVVTMLSIVWFGFILLNYVGYIVAAIFYILSFSWILRERGRAAWIAALVTPVLVYGFLEMALGVRLPSLLDLLR